MQERNLTGEPAIERATAESFLRFYNKRHGSRYQIVDLQASCVRCADEHTQTRFDLEICALEEPSGEERHPRDRRSTPSGALGTGVQSVRGETVERIIERLKAELETRRHTDTALVVRQLAPTWSRNEWAMRLLQVPWSRIGFRPEAFDRGIWALGVKAEGAFPPGGLLEGAVDFFRIDPYRPRPSRARERWSHLR